MSFQSCDLGVGDKACRVSLINVQRPNCPGDPVPDDSLASLNANMSLGSGSGGVDDWLDVYPCVVSQHRGREDASTSLNRPFLSLSSSFPAVTCCDALRCLAGRWAGTVSKLWGMSVPLVLGEGRMRATDLSSGERHDKLIARIGDDEGS